MKLKTRNASLALAGLAALKLAAGSAAAESKATTNDIARAFPGAAALRLVDFTGGVEIAAVEGEMSVVLTQGGEPYAVDLVEKDGTLVVSGPKRPRDFKIYKALGKWRNGEDALEAYLADFPKLQITAPPGADIHFDDAIVLATAGDGLGHIEIEKGLVEGVFGDVASADIAISSSGDLSMGAIEGPAKIRIGGSGDFEAASAGEADLTIGGSGDIEIGAVSGDLDVKIGGSGDVEAGDIAGVLNARVGGSGSISTMAVAAGANLTIAGSGDMHLASVNGPTRVNIAGTGDIAIDDGRAEDLHVSIAGHGDFQFDGVSTNLVAAIVGSGSIDVARNEGSLETSGTHGEIRVNGKSIKLNDDHRHH